MALGNLDQVELRSVRVLVAFLLLGSFTGCVSKEARADTRRIRQWGNRFAAEHEKDKNSDWVAVQTDCLERAIEEHNSRFPYAKMEVLKSGGSKSKVLCPGLDANR